MPNFPNALQAWRSDLFNRALKDEIESMGTEALPLHKGTSQGGFVDDADVTATVFKSREDERFIFANVGIFFTEIIAGCSCGEEPESISAYCRLQIRIDKTSAEAEACLVPD